MIGNDLATPRPTSLLRSLAIQLRVIRALMMREIITRFGRHNFGVLWLFGEPMIFTAAVTTLWTTTGMHRQSTLPIEAFAISGYSTVLIWRNTAGRCNSALEQNLNLLYHRNVRALDVFITRIMLEISGATASFFVLGSAMVLSGMIAPPDDITKVVGGWLMMGWFGFGLGLTLGSANAYSELVDRLWHPTSYILFPLSGAAFLVQWLPPKLQNMVLILPMVHGVEYVREGWFGPLMQAHHNLAYMATINLCLTLSGLVLMQGAVRHLEQR